jgi:hypothetical protein
VTTFAGQTVDSTAVLIKYTWSGDANLDGIANLADFNRLASNFGQSPRIWPQGDFNFDGTADLADFNLMASNFGQSSIGGGGGGGGGFAPNGPSGGGGGGEEEGGGGNGTDGYTIDELLDHLLSGGHGLPPR